MTCLRENILWNRVFSRFRKQKLQPYDFPHAFTTMSPMVARAAPWRLRRWKKAPAATSLRKRRHLDLSLQRRPPPSSSILGLAWLEHPNGQWGVVRSSDNTDVAATSTPYASAHMSKSCLRLVRSTHFDYIFFIRIDASLDFTRYL
jgi:hypothetical protein